MNHQPKLLHKFQIGWDYVPTVPTFLEPCWCRTYSSLSSPVPSPPTVRSLMRSLTRVWARRTARRAGSAATASPVGRSRWAREILSQSSSEQSPRQTSCSQLVHTGNECLDCFNEEWFSSHHF